ncbi:C40 family peptidase [Paenibacillus macquariensis]|uniref:NlpC/P60 family protein n=1 Tax=Paenibacillus macquariensis TaxID=948756 RepID=A0ABY1KD99_9BACL|nr:C40 family peptidase [Paenibacillus macquariensis]MEC0093391.1 C40 family peptidase [Paenibacillus macquariensis]OAB29286.1 hydrolase [Paenibacillus macquariensis subsp. macquariensis]SIR63583.1 NlpC/P60 family protein [Paenibacillus macquariensis]
MKKKLTTTVLGLALLFSIGTGSAFADSALDKAIAPAIGSPYVASGNDTSGFDCSGFTTYVFNKLSIDLPRQSGSQYSMGTAVSRNDLREGDLVFFNTTGKGVSHVGIFVGNGKFAHASSSNGVIINSLSESYYVSRYVGAKRIMSNDTYESVAIDK